MYHTMFCQVTNPSSLVSCPYPNCNIYYRNSLELRIHCQREHHYLALKPFKCLFPGCRTPDWALYGDLEAHIRGEHLKRRRVLARSQQDTSVKKDEEEEAVLWFRRFARLSHRELFQDFRVLLLDAAYYCQALQLLPDLTPAEVAQLAEWKKKVEGERVMEMTFRSRRKSNSVSFLCMRRSPNVLVCPPYCPQECCFPDLEMCFKSKDLPVLPLDLSRQG